MVSTAILAFAALSRALTIHEALSGILGSISLATWIFLLVPQLILNYKTGSAEAISLVFLAVWLIGDLTNIIGAIWAELVPTVIALGVYFCLADFVLISQCLYYNYVNAVREKRVLSTALANSEDAPLLSRARSDESLGLPGSRRRSSVRRSLELRRDSLSKIVEEDDDSNGNPWLKNTISILLVVLAGTAGWAIAWQSGVWSPVPEVGDTKDPKEIAVGPQILGYISAACYLGARIPQIIKNYRDKSCEGLALLFFLLSLMGNATYGAGILFHSLEREYFIKNLPWLIGSLGTIVEDGVIFAQFRIYAKRLESSSAIVG